MNEMQQTLTPGASFEYYTNTVYWNDFPLVQEHLNRIATGDPAKSWLELTRRYLPAQKLLSLNCGNGWVEREFYHKGLAWSVLGVDISEPLLNEARNLAQAEGVLAEYRVMDANKPDLFNLGFDCVLNHAALHHVAYLDGILREILANMPRHGFLINYDYIGPHRNQYPWEQWSRVVELWDRMPHGLRPDVLRYPHLNTMLAGDPTEAVHSELIVNLMQRYFHVVEQRALGGAIAYPLLWQNIGLFNARETLDGRRWLQEIIDLDAEYTDGKLENSYFGIMICRPKREVLEDAAQLAAWTDEEARRERKARENGGRYDSRRALEIIYDRL